MKFTDLFIRKPVLATVVSLFILVLGVKAGFSLSILQYPQTENAVVTITTTYYGADPDVVAGFLTTPIENAVAQANGIDYMQSTSINSVSTITVYLRLNYDPDKALTEIQTKVNSVLNQLPQGTQQPVMKVSIGQTIDAMYLGFNSDVLQSNQITDFLVRVVQPRLQAVTGVQTAELIGAKNFALRAWLDPVKLAAYDLTAADISSALAANDYISGIGTTKGAMVQYNLSASTSLHTLDEFRALVIKQVNGANVHLGDVANVMLGSDDYESAVGFDGKQAVYIGIQVAPSANLLDVIKAVRAEFPGIQAQFPQGMNGEIVYDSTKFVNSAINEVESTLFQALLIVTVVVFVFLGSPRSVIIPVVAIPLSLVGAFAIMLALGFSINLLTLLALVLGIGLVVDDAIIVVENVNRHIEEGKTPIDAAIVAARELTGPIIAMTVVLIAVYVPVGFQSGLTGALFTEFAFTLVAAVTVSAIIALTLSPMMSSKFLKPLDKHGRGWEARLVNFIDRTFERIAGRYRRALHGSLDYRPVTYLFAAIILVSIYFLFGTAANELAPQEDEGIIIAQSIASPSATLAQRQLYSRQVYETYTGFPETSNVFQLDVPGQSLAGMVLKPWDERTRTSNQLQPLVQTALNNVAGTKTAAFQLPSLPGAQGFPIQFVIGTTNNFSQLNEVSQKFMADAMKTGMFMFLDSDLKYDQPQGTIVIDRDKAAQMGLQMSDVGGAMAWMLGGGYVNYFSMEGRSYKVMPQVEQNSRQTLQQLMDYHIHAPDGTTVPISTIAHIEDVTVPESINHFQQLNDALIGGVPMPGVTLGAAVEKLQELAQQDLPSGYSVDYGGTSRQYIQEGSGFITTIGLATIIIFLALAAQFESFRDPLIILVSVPMSIAGAMLFINIMGMGPGTVSVNIYTKVGLVTLMGLVSKHGILMVEFANEQQRHAGMTKREAIEAAAGIRLRPILMTTAAMVLGVVPMLVASGAGAVSRFNMGLVIATGLSIGTLFTLFVVPAFYLLLGADHHEAHAKEGQGELSPAE
jgi:multidrug efflux pump